MKRAKVELKHLFQKVKGYEHVGASMFEIGEELDFNEQKTKQISEYLEREGLVECPARGLIRLTHEGFKVASDLFESQQPTQYSSQEIRTVAHGSTKIWDVFICHAGEDKDAVAKPLANALIQAGLRSRQGTKFPFDANAYIARTQVSGGCETIGGALSCKVYLLTLP